MRVSEAFRCPGSVRGINHSPWIGLYAAVGGAELPTHPPQIVGGTDPVRRLFVRSIPGKLLLAIPLTVLQTRRRLGHEPCS